MLRSAEKNTPRKVKRGEGEESKLGSLAKHRLSVPDLDSVLSSISTTNTDKKPEKKSLFSFGSKPRIKKALEKMNIISKSNG